jgi:outer membrane protein OmpA-like peptidoglycan-associated protein
VEGRLGALVGGSQVFERDFVVLRSPGETLKIRNEPAGAVLDPEARETARRASALLRFGLDARDRLVIEGAQRLVHLLDGHGAFELREIGQSEISTTFLDALSRRLESELSRGRLVAEFFTEKPITVRDEVLELELPPLPPPRREGPETFFEVRFVDEVGQAINGVPSEYRVDGGLREVTTNAAGVALLEGVRDSTAQISIEEVEALENVLEPRWTKRRPGVPPKESNTTTLAFRGTPVGPVSVKAVVPNRVILEPPLGRLFVELLDKTGRVRHANREYTITGPEEFSGTTDDLGQLVHEGVFPGDYELSFTVESFEGKDSQVDAFRTPLVVLAPDRSEPERRLLGAVPQCVLARLHLFFNTNKTFLLPTALPEMRALRRIYLNRAPCELLVVGHADTAGGTAYNDQLSLERAEATIAFLKDHVEGWFKFYGDGIEEKKRWGKVEDRLMITAMPDFRTKSATEDLVSWFQRTRGVSPIDGKCGKDTRRKLIEVYMTLDGASLSEFDVEISATAHGCGEHFPLEETGQEVEEAPADGESDPIDRRVELLFFDPEFGIVPKPPGKNSKAGSKEYPAWRKAATETIDLAAGDLDGLNLTFVEFDDARYRTNSCVVLPEGEQPDAKEHKALASTSLVATLLRFNEEQLEPGQKLLIAGHTDTTASEGFNQALSEERAKCVLACVVGDRESFQSLCDARHTVGDYKQILSWLTKAFSDRAVGEGGFDCDPGPINDNQASGTSAVKRFQAQYNQNKAALGASAPDLAVDGDVGPLTWGAFFDVYEFALREELGDEPGLDALRGLLVFVDDENKALGYGEHHPIDGLGEDNFRSQANRRVEALFFEPGEEPEIAIEKEDPASSELYLPGKYVRNKLSSQTNPREPVLKLQILDARRKPMPGASYSLTVGETEATGVTDEDGFLVERVPEGAEGGVLVVQQGPTVKLLFRPLDDAATPKGAQDRLSNLGLLHHSAANGKEDDDFRRLLSGAQDSIDLDVTGKLDDPTQGELARQHLS